MIKSRQEFKEKADKINSELLEMLIFLKDENKDEGQFDYTNTPNINIENLASRAKQLNEIWFQE